MWKNHFEEQLEIMEEYTRVHKENSGKPKEIRELECLKVLYPKMFRSIEPQDKIAGRLDFFTYRIWLRNFFRWCGALLCV